MIQEQIFAAISGDPDVIDIAGTRIYPVRLPENVNVPAAVYQMSLDTSINSLNGDSGLDIQRLEVRAWAKDYSTAHKLAAAIRTALINTAGFKIVTDFQDDDQDYETLNYSVVTQYSIWSIFDIAAVPPGPVTSKSIREFVSYPFDGDGITTTFIFPSIFRAGSLVVFRNGAVAKKNDRYTELVDRTGILFPIAPKGGAYKDEFLAYYAKE